MKNILRLSMIAALSALVAESASAGKPLSPQVELVTQLYRQYACEAVIEIPELSNCSLLDQPKSTLIHFFDPRLAQAITQDRICTKKSRELCRLDFMPLWDSQDASGAVVSVGEGKNPTTVIADISYPQTKRQLTYSLKKTKHGWRIVDIAFGNSKRSLMGILASH
jgi:hypothetical protein